MKNNVCHGIILDAEFDDPDFVKQFKIFARRKSTDSPWILFGIEIEEKDLSATIVKIQKNLKTNKPYYAHLYNDESLIIIFKETVLYVKPHISTWKKAIEYGRKLKIPEEQLDFWPNRFQDEVHYFKKENL